MSESKVVINFKAIIDERFTGVVMNETPLPGKNPYVVQHIQIMGIVDSIRIGHDEEFTKRYGGHDEVWLSPEQFLDLMKWGEDIRTTLESKLENAKKKAITTRIDDLFVFENDITSNGELWGIKASLKWDRDKYVIIPLNFNNAATSAAIGALMHNYFKDIIDHILEINN